VSSPLTGVPSWSPCLGVPLWVSVAGSLSFAFLPVVWLDPAHGWAPGFTVFLGSDGTAMEKR
jgi:hypothetical protein